MEGNGDALREIVEKYGAGLMLFINRYVNNLSIAEELMEDTFCELVFRRGAYKGESSFKTYLYTIGKNKAVDYIRKSAKYGVVPIEDVAAELRELTLLEDMVIKDEQSRELWSAMNGIGEEYRSVLYLLYFEEMSYDSMGKVLKKSVKQIKNLAYRARKALKGELERRGFVYEDL